MNGNGSPPQTPSSGDPRPDDQPPAHRPFADAVADLSNLVDGPLPDEWLTLLSHYPPQLRDCRRGDGETDAGLVSQVELLADIEAVVELNREARATTVLDPDGEPFTWPRSLLVIGETGGGDYFCLDAEREFDGVLQYEHQPVQFFQITDSLQEFVDMLQQSFAPE